MANRTKTSPNTAEQTIYIELILTYRPTNCHIFLFKKVLRYNICTLAWLDSLVQNHCCKVQQINGFFNNSSVLVNNVNYSA